jgi:hypothetical protein
VGTFGQDCLSQCKFRSIASDEVTTFATRYPPGHADLQILTDNPPPWHFSLLLSAEVPATWLLAYDAEHATLKRYMTISTGTVLEVGLPGANPHPRRYRVPSHTWAMGALGGCAGRGWI